MSSPASPGHGTGHGPGNLHDRADLGGLAELAVAGVITLDSTADENEDDVEDFTELIPLTTLPVQLPAKGSAPPARNAAELVALLRTAQASDTVLAGTAGWLLSERRASPRTQDAYIKEASWWLWWLQARGLELDRVPYAEADLFAAAMRHAGYQPGSRRRRLSALSSWYGYLVRAQAAETNPFDGMELPKRRSKPTRHLTEAQLDDLVTFAVERESTRTAAIVALLKATACRISELTDVGVDALGHAGAQRIITLLAKGGQRHQVVIAEVTGRILDAYLAERGDAPGPLFLTRTGLGLRRSYVWELIQRLAAAVDIPDPANLSLHSIRHSVATALLQAGEPLDVVQALLGHADPRTTQTYLHVEELERSPAHRADSRLAVALARSRRAAPVDPTSAVAATDTELLTPDSQPSASSTASATP
ncbi:tyrosine-type recombinase/integrase [Nonomuraea sp. NPDC050663]|uniref:tyrosine-type recombinase/integrase n=1 Tax=Nonomuraea sp. NPDC050663 TaxID=3364370 RepID=UPI00378EC9F7